LEAEALVSMWRLRLIHSLACVIEGCGALREGRAW